MKIFSKERLSRAGEFFRRNGFYIALFVCIAGLGLAAALMLTGDEPEELPQNELSQEVESITAPDLSTEIARRGGNTAPEVSASPLPSEDVSEETQEEEEKPSAGRTQAAVTLKRPVEGEILHECSLDRLVFNHTLNQWATHNGADIAGSEGAEVKAALSGSVSQLYSDPIAGSVIVIDHGGSHTLYAGVEPAVGIEVGSRVNSGELIGTLSGVPFEAAAGPHLHFEYVVAGEFRDPAKYFEGQ